jgi:hypothetical protein
MPVLLDNFDSGPLAMSGSGTGKQGTDGMNGLTIAANDPPDIALTQLNFEDGRLAAGNFREHHLIGILDYLSNDELEKFLHDVWGGFSSTGGGAGCSCGDGGVLAVAIRLFFLIKLRTVSEA